ncbi:unnamed protein product [Citrullus colocynthis]|uniref:Uncharacterized protein n=1 Tax=Citrullus colocynthis TaxID=252529 RepID=A0ABP0Y7R7_9ROSI
MSDTGNLVLENPNTPFSHFPYGESFSKNATSRCSNDLLMIDYFALDAGLPLLNPYLNKNASTNHGVNFAVAGATTFPFETLFQKNITGLVTNSSLSHQFDWMFSHFNFICHNPTECHDKLNNALFIVEIGGNDYNFAMLKGQSLEQLKDLTPDEAISYGTTRVIVAGNFPIGCLPFYLTSYPTNDTTTYDEFHCLKDFNALATHHNKQIKKVIKVLRKENPHTIIVYADFYNALQSILHHATNLGFDEASLQKSCCGIGGNYNYDLQNTCGAGVPVYQNPNNHISWDGVHMTQNAYKFMAHLLFENMFPKLRCIV